MVHIDSELLPSYDILAELGSTKDDGQALLFDLGVLLFYMGECSGGERNWLFVLQQGSPKALLAGIALKSYFGIHAVVSQHWVA